MLTKTTWRYHLPALLATLILICSVSAAQVGKADSDKSFFGEDEVYFDAGLILSPSVLRGLIQRPENSYIHGAKPSDVRKFFRGATVQLNQANPGEVDLVLAGNFPLDGVDQGWFWIVTSADNQPKVKLWLPGNSVRLLASHHHGYRDIVSTWESVNERRTKTYQFDGRSYKLVKTEWKDLAQH